MDQKAVNSLMQPSPECPNDVREENARLRAEVETERLRLAACGVAAMQNTVSSITQRLTRDNPYWSASYGDVCGAVDREMTLRAEIERLTEELSGRHPSYQSALALLFTFVCPEESFDPTQPILMGKRVKDAVKRLTGILDVYRRLAFYPDGASPEEVLAHMEGVAQGQVAEHKRLTGELAAVVDSRWLRFLKAAQHPMFVQHAHNLTRYGEWPENKIAAGEFLDALAALDRKEQP